MSGRACQRTKRLKNALKKVTDSAGWRPNFGPFSPFGPTYVVPITSCDPIFARGGTSKPWPTQWACEWSWNLLGIQCTSVFCDQCSRLCIVWSTTSLSTIKFSRGFTKGKDRKNDLYNGKKMPCIHSVFVWTNSFEIRLVLAYLV